MNNRNKAIVVGVIILLYFFSRKKDIVDTMVDDAVNGGGGGGGIGGGGFPLIPPINTGTGTGTTSTQNTNVITRQPQGDPIQGGTRNPIEDQKPRDVVLAPEFTYVRAFAQRPLSIRVANTNTFRNFAVNSAIEIAQPKAGNNFTHPKINPAQTLILGKDVDLMAIATPTGGGTPPKTGGTTSGGATGGTMSGGTTTPRVGGIGSSAGSTSGLTKPPSGSL
jgi:hypothetical protein